MLPAGEPRGVYGLPQHRHVTARPGADEVPLPPAKMARTGDQTHKLIEPADLDATPEFVREPSLFDRDEARSNFLAPIAISPTNSAPAGCAGANNSFPSKVV